MVHTYVCALLIWDQEQSSVQAGGSPWDCVCLREMGSVYMSFTVACSSTSLNLSGEAVA